MKKKASKWSIPIIAFISIVFVIIGLGHEFVKGTQKDVNIQNRQYLSKLATQNSRVIKEAVETELDKLEMLANVISAAGAFDLQDTMQTLTAEVERGDFKRLAYVPQGGEAVTTDKADLNIEDRVHYQRALKGESCVSDVITDKVGGGGVNVYAVPLYAKGQENGVIIATKASDVFSEILDHGTFFEEGYSYIIKQDGTAVAFGDTDSKQDKFDNLFDKMRKDSVREESIQKMQENMAEGRDGIIEYDGGGVSRVGAYAKIGINDWYTVSVTPRDELYETSDRIVMRNRVGVGIITVLLTGLCVLVIDQNYKSNKRLVELAYTDPLTKGNNLNRFKMLALKALEKNCEGLYVVRIDIDDFKLLNDRYGYQEGDRILLLMSQLISSILTKEDIYGRDSNDNFLCMIRVKDEGEVLDLGKRFREEFKTHMEQSEKQYSVNFTTGVYKVLPEDKDIDKMIDRATMAHRSAKLLPSERKFAFYSQDMREAALQAKGIEDVMWAAMNAGQFVIYCQPKFNLETEEIEGAEALVRWVRDGVLLPPSVFLPIFERNGFIATLDLYVLEQVCRLQRYFLDMGIKPVPISVNQSKPLVYGQNYAVKIMELIEKYNLPPHLIELELLEGLIHENIEELERIVDRLHQFGTLICIDDFGSGYSSLNLLKDIPADVLKIDRAFLNNAEKNERAETILKNIVALAKGLDMSVVMEGVETQNQALLMKKIGCTTIQGYLFAKPMPAIDFEEQLKKRNIDLKFTNLVLVQESV